MRFLTEEWDWGLAPQRGEGQMTMQEAEQLFGR